MNNIDRQNLEQAQSFFQLLLSKDKHGFGLNGFLKHKPYVIFPSLHWKLESRYIVPLGSSGGKNPDLFFYPLQQAETGFWGAIKVRRHPRDIVLEPGKNIVMLARDAETAAEQSQKYADLAGKSAVYDIPGDHLFLGTEYYLFILMGVTQNKEKFSRTNREEYLHLVRELPANLKVLPYNFLRENFKSRTCTSVFTLVSIAPAEKSPVILRSNPLSLAVENVDEMIQAYGFYEAELNWTGSGLKHHYEVVERQNQRVVFDRATQLFWQREGSRDYGNFETGREYLHRLNDQRYAGWNDWRFPTLEEAMSLMEPKKHGSLYIDPVFSPGQRRIWTNDRIPGSSGHWTVLFDYGRCQFSVRYGLNYLVRAVRSGQSTVE
ncbi:DUF1566 domain-containing protein [candidate division KSB1 bacterium]|nr:MAG: DUF1566 domain-containing protein [candidate division KSB1 bacterium]